jgi:hypothetical protein
MRITGVSGLTQIFEMLENSESLSAEVIDGVLPPSRLTWVRLGDR